MPEMRPPPDASQLLADVAMLLGQLRGDDFALAGGVTPETRFFADLGLASIDAVVLGERLQARHGAGLPFGDLMSELGRRADRDLSLGELVDFLVEHTPRP